MRAHYPDDEGYVDRDGVRIFYEAYENDGASIVLVPTWPVFDSRAWKMQIPYLARHFRVLVVEGRGNGHSDHPQGVHQYGVDVFADDILAVMDATGTTSGVLLSFSCGALWALEIGYRNRHRVRASVFIGPAVPLVPQLEERRVQRRDEKIESPIEWEKYNVHFWQSHYHNFLEFLVGKIFSEAHSTKQSEDGVSWGLTASPQVLADSDRALDPVIPRAVRDMAEQADYPVLVIHGSDDRVRNVAQGEALASLSAGEFHLMEGSGHAPQLRDPVNVNLLIRDFIERVAA